MSLLKHRTHPRPAPKSYPTQYDTSDTEDVRLLAAAILTTIQEAEYDDMTWAEVDAALRLASHHVKINWAATGTVEPLPPAAPETARR